MVVGMLANTHHFSRFIPLFYEFGALFLVVVVLVVYDCCIWFGFLFDSIYIYQLRQFVVDTGTPAHFQASKPNQWNYYETAKKVHYLSRRFSDKSL